MRTTTDRFRAIGTNALQLCGVVARDSQEPLRLADAQIVAVRDLAALTRSVPFARLEPRPADVKEYRAMVEGAFASRVVIPAPFGTVFRSREALIGWMELHYGALADALRFLEDRQMARVRVEPGIATRDWVTQEQSTGERNLEVTVFDSFRVLKKHAVAFAPVQLNKDVVPEGAEAAFLVERAQWEEFCNMVKDEQRRLPDLRFHQTGPWPPYDFVRLEFE